MTLTGSIDTTAIDPYRQGVELTLPGFFGEGIAKIWSGYPNHQVIQHEFGEVTITDPTTPFEERRKFATTDYLISGSRGQRKAYDFLTRKQIARTLDGAIEPLMHRSGSVDGFPVLVQGPKGELESGNPTAFGDTDRIVDEFVPARTGSMFAFVDGTDVIRRRTYVSGTNRVPSRRKIFPYADAFPAKPGIALPSSASVAFISARNQMSGSDQNSRLGNNARAMTAGFVYDGASSGTDSLAFGGLKW